jgi:hypothetical protein
MEPMRPDRLTRILMMSLVVLVWLFIAIGFLALGVSIYRMLT